MAPNMVQKLSANESKLESGRLIHHCCHHFAGYPVVARQPGTPVSRGQLHMLHMSRPKSNELRDMKEGGNASRWLQDGDQGQPRRFRRSLKQTSSQQKVCMRGDHSCPVPGRQQKHSWMSNILALDCLMIRLMAAQTRRRQRTSRGQMQCRVRRRRDLTAAGGTGSRNSGGALLCSPRVVRMQRAWEVPIQGRQANINSRYSEDASLPI